MPLEIANLVSSISNISLIIGAILALGGTIGSIISNATIARYADERIASNELLTARANQGAELANQRTVEIEQTNLSLQLELERERSDRLRLEQKLAPRLITPDKMSDAAATLSVHAGQKAHLNCLLGDPESRFLCNDIATMLIRAGWDVDDEPAQVMWGGGTPVGVMVEVFGHDIDKKTTSAALTLNAVLADLTLVRDGAAVNFKESSKLFMNISVGKRILSPESLLRMSP